MSKKLRSISDSSRYVVGLFGGSVALRVRIALEQRLRHMLDSQGMSKELTLVTFATPGFKQPQQLLQLAFLLSEGARFDLVLNLDGYNEAVLSIAENHDRGIYPTYPRLWDLRVQKTREIRQAKAELDTIRGRLDRMDSLLTETHLRYSVYSGLLHRFLNQSLENQFLWVNKSVIENTSRHKGRGAAVLEKTGPQEGFSSRQELVDHVVSTWWRSSIMMAGMAAAQGGRYIHFLQPNQYLKNSKPLSDLERNSAHSEQSAGFRYVGLVYPEMIGQAPRFKAMNVEFHDFSSIFNKITETLYVDTCCHFNEQGNWVLADAMIRKIMDSPSASF